MSTHSRSMMARKPLQRNRFFHLDNSEKAKGINKINKTTNLKLREKILIKYHINKNIFLVKH